MEKDFQKQIDDIEESMYSYAQECKSDGDEGGYSPKHIRKCKKILQTYLNHLNKMTAPTDGVIMAEVEKTVLALNRLNEKTDYELIETDEREAIAEFIQTAALAFGLQEPDGDITEEWREW